MRLKIIAISALLLALGLSSPAQQPEKRVMEFLAVLDLNCGEEVKKSLAAPLTNIIIEEIVKIGKYTVIDRANRDKILAEVGFQQSGCVEESCVVEMGQMLGVGKIVVGNIDLLGETYLINLQFINVQTGAVEVAASETCKCELDGLILAVRNASRKLMGEKPISSSSSETQPAPPEPPSKNSCYVLVYSIKYKNPGRANKFAKQTENKGFPAGAAFHPESNKYLVYIGPYNSFSEAKNAKEEVRRKLMPLEAMMLAPPSWEIWPDEACESVLKNKTMGKSE